jgi:toxin YoeB
MNFLLEQAMRYRIEFAKESLKQILQLQKSSPHSYKKLEIILSELREHPYTGTGHPEQLKYLGGVWSRKLDKKNRVCYTIDNFTVVVYIVSVMGHYGDK